MMPMPLDSASFFISSTSAGEKPVVPLTMLTFLLAAIRTAGIAAAARHSGARYFNPSEPDMFACLHGSGNLTALGFEAAAEEIAK